MTKVFFILRGLDPKEFTAKENALVFVGVSSHIAEKRGKQDSFRNVLRKAITTRTYDLMTRVCTNQPTSLTQRLLAQHLTTEMLSTQTLRNHSTQMSSVTY